MVRRQRILLLHAGLLACAVAQGSAAAPVDEVPYDHYLPSKWNTVSPGVYSAEYPPAIRIKSGDTVKIDNANTSGARGSNPSKFFESNGIPLDLPAVQDILEILEKTPPHPAGLRGALLTGPVYVEGAEPGDTLEVRVHDIRFRAAYGVNSTNPGSGHPLADMVPRPWTQKFDLDLERNVAIFKKGEIELPLAPFFGQMGVAPPADAGGFGAGPPTNIHGGNFDLQEITRGSTLFLPVNVPGALFFTGNGHALQGNGEITNPSLEVSLTGYLQFIVHKGRKLEMPRVETPTHYIFLGIHESLDEGVRQAALETVKFLQEKEGLDFYDAYALTSVSADFTVARALLPKQMVYTFLPKHVFTKPIPYWYTGPVPTRY
ncbi:MAG: acetamidase/formamidase family protein [Opitutaceae bacterium]|nr:acetamidase/formamidase family protein [Opitutaceae bacterium]